MHLSHEYERYIMLFYGFGVLCTEGSAWLLYVTIAFECTYIVFQNGIFFMWQTPCKESLPYVIDSLLRWMTHVLSIETVVAQLIHDDFVCREVIDSPLISKVVY